jgi:phosphatidylinositol N-acetylglucosaminyltransferase subunit Q
MVMSNGLMRLFWPSDAPNEGTAGVLVGWRNSDYDALVVAILQDVEAGHNVHPCRGYPTDRRS